MSLLLLTQGFDRAPSARLCARIKAGGIPAIASEPIAASGGCRDDSRRIKTSGAGNIASSVTKPVARANPIPPLNAVRKAPSTKNCVRMFLWVAPALYAGDFLGALAHRDQHDVDDAIAPSPESRLRPAQEPIHRIENLGHALHVSMVSQSSKASPV